jgi:hypothetical protein
MEVYYDKQKISVKICRFFSKLLLLVGIIMISYSGLLYFKVLTSFNDYFNIITFGAIALLIGGIVFFIISKLINKRKNIRFDGTIIRFCVNKEVEHEFNIRNIDELFNFRSDSRIPFGSQDNLAFRFHKNEVWEVIPSNYLSRKKQTSSFLINDINNVYANIKLNRSIKEIDDTQGVRFIYLSVNDDQDINSELQNFEKTFTQYGNTYGAFESNRVVLTNDSIYYNKKCLASINNKDYIKLRKHDIIEDKYYHSDIVDIYNNNDDLIMSLDLTLMMNALYFKLLLLTIFEEQREEYQIINEETKKAE